MTHIHFTLELLQDLKRAYNKAIEQHETAFMFQDNELLTSYAKYLIEYLETVLGPDPRMN